MESKMKKIIQPELSMMCFYDVASYMQEHGENISDAEIINLVHSTFYSLCNNEVRDFVKFYNLLIVRKIKKDVYYVNLIDEKNYFAKIQILREKGILANVFVVLEDSITLDESINRFNSIFENYKRKRDENMTRFENELVNNGINGEIFLELLNNYNNQMEGEDQRLFKIKHESNNKKD